MADPFFGSYLQVAGAAAADIYSKIITVSVKPFLGTGRGAALWFQANVDVWVGNNSSLTNSSGDGFLLPAGTPFPDSAPGSGSRGGHVPVNKFFIYTPGGSVSISAASNASPVSLTSVAHGLITGDQVTISGGTGAWAAINGTFTVTVTSADTFTVPVDSTAFGALAGTIVFGKSATVSVYYRSAD